MRAGVPFHSRRGILNPTQQAINRILTLPGLEAAYLPYIPGLTQPFVGTTNASSWPDMSGKGRDQLQATGAAQLVINADGSLQANGTTMSMATSGSINIVQPSTIYARVHATSPTSHGGILSTTSGNIAGLIQPLTPPGISVYGGTEVVNSVTITDAIHTLCAVSNGASSVVGVDANEVTGNASAGALNGLLVLALFGSSFTAGKFALELLFSVAHDLNTRNQVRADIATICAGIT